MDTLRPFLHALIRDPAVRLAALVGGGVGGLLVLAGVWLIAPDAPPPAATQRPSPARQLAAPVPPSPAPKFVARQPAPVSQYPSLPVSRDGDGAGGASPANSPAPGLPQSRQPAPVETASAPPVVLAPRAVPPSARPKAMTGWWYFRPTTAP